MDNEFEFEFEPELYLEPSQDKVTICLFSKENDSEHGFNEEIFNQAEHIETIRRLLTKVATTYGRPPPKFVVSVLLIPDKSKPDMSNAYDTSQYQQKKDRFVEKATHLFSNEQVTVHDFYENLTPAEKPYLHQLHSPGNCLDMMKTKAILDNANCRHLQLDSNTIITNYNALYIQTFLAEEQQDAMNASCYGTTLVTTHNKIVYTHPER
jgi:hypothetical protein